MQPVAPTSPGRPSAWTDAVQEAARQHTAEAYPSEAVGIVQRGEYVRLENQSPSPTLDVALADLDLVRAAQAELFFHSHPDGLGCPSESDMRYQQQLGLPFVVMCWPIYDLFWWGDMLPAAPLLGRGFRHGVHDCFSLIRDWYAQERGLRLPNPPRDWDWWSKQRKLDLYRDNFETAGFREIALSEAIQPGDGLLMAFNYAVPMHGAVVVDRDLILHHPAGLKPLDPTRLSTLAPRSRFVRHITIAVRHAS
jgi:cell wall-associated NlpC family hydrolase